MRSNNREDAPELKDCLSAETLLQFQRNELTRRERKRARCHIASCPACARESILVLETILLEPQLVREMRERIPGGKRRLFPAAIYTAASLLVLLLGAYYLFRSRPQTSNEEQALRGVTIAVIEPTRVMSTPKEPAFRWNAVPGSEYYIVEIFNESLDLFWRSPKIRDNTALLPKSFAESMKSGSRYAWLVTAHMPDGRTVKSALMEFRIQ